MISLAVAAADWVGLVHPEITPPSNFHHLRDTTHNSPSVQYCSVSQVLGSRTNSRTVLINHDQVVQIQPRFTSPSVSAGHSRIVEAGRIWCIYRRRAEPFVMAEEHWLCLGSIGGLKHRADVGNRSARPCQSRNSLDDRGDFWRCDSCDFCRRKLVPKRHDRRIPRYPVRSSRSLADKS